MFSAGLAMLLCFVPTDQTPGWKRAEMTAAAPWLAAQGALQQFRSGEAALVWDSGSVDYRGASKPVLGRTEYSFQVDQRVRRLEVQFYRDLDGAKVDAVGWAGARFPLQTRERIGGDHLLLEWTGPALSAVTLAVHQHLRRTPVVQSVRGGYLAVVTQEPWAPAAFRQPLSLYYLQPGGVEVRLCLEPGHTLEVERSTVSGAPALTMYTQQK